MVRQKRIPWCAKTVPGVLTLLLAVGQTALTCPAGADGTVAVDPAVRYQTVQGWGTSLCWWASVVGGYPKPLRDELLNKVFNARSGLGLTIVRYNIGGGDDPSHTHMEPRARIPGFLDAAGKWHWDADANQRLILLQAKRMGVNTFEAFSNSPPYWMTSSGCAAGAADAGDNLPAANYAPFADYLTQVVAEYKKRWGIRFETLSPLNEPYGGYWKQYGRQEGCCFARPSQNAVIKAVGAALAAKGLDTTVSGPEENSSDWTVQSWDSYDIDAKNYVSSVNTHAYWGGSQHWVHHRATRDTKRTWMSEYGDGDASGLSLSRQILRDMKDQQSTGWVYWQAIDNGGGWGFLDMDINHQSHTYVTNKKYYVMGQYSKFIRPGYKILAVNDGSSLAALDPSGTTLVVVTTNSGSTASSVNFDLSRFASVGAQAGWHLTDMTSANNLTLQKPIKLLNGHFTASLPPQSVSTFVIRKVAFTKTAFEGYYRLRNSQSQQALEVPGGSWNYGTALGMTDASGDYSQQWQVAGTGDGLYRLLNRNTGLYAVVNYGDAHWPVIQWEDNGDDTLNWQFSDLGSGNWSLTNHKVGGALDDNQHRNNGYADVVAYPWWGGLEQKWWFDWQTD